MASVRPDLRVIIVTLILVGQSDNERCLVRVAKFSATGLTEARYRWMTAQKQVQVDI